MNEWILLITEILGTIAFAVSGTLVAINCGLDIFGVLVVGCITATGGGIIRDLCLGRTPPAIFSNLPIFLVAALTCIVVFIIAYFKREHFDRFRHNIEKINNVFDAIGLAAFSVMGVEAALLFGHTDNVFFAVLMGLITGIGGGIMRDVLTNTTPYVLKKHIYAVASITGCIIYYVIQLFCPHMIVSTLAAMVTVVTIRMLAAHYRWQLPRIVVKHENNEK